MADLYPGFYPGAYPGGTSGASGPVASTTINVTPEPDATPPRMRLDIVTDQTALVIWRVAQDGSRTKVPTYDGGPLAIFGTTAVIYDTDVPQGELVTYTVDGLSSLAASGPLSVDSGRVWLVHPAVPTRSVPIRVAGMSERSADADQSIRYPLARKFPIIANDGVRKADTYTLRVRTQGQAELDGLKLLLSDLSTLFLNVPASRQWVDLGSEYISVGNLQRGNPTNWGRFQHREWVLPCAVTERPTGGSQAFITYGYSRSLYATYGDRFAAHATYGEAFDPK